MKYGFILILLGLILGACQPKDKSGGSSEISEKFADFEAFYERFHTDSLYQVEHIIFPLEGLPADADSITLATGNYRWEKDSWIMHRRFDQGSNDFEIQLTPVMDDVIIEKIIHKSGAYGMIRRFARMGGEWYLIYYAGLNRLNVGQEESVG